MVRIALRPLARYDGRRYKGHFLLRRHVAPDRHIMQGHDRHLGQRIGPFVLEQRLGDHGFVYHAVDVDRRRSVALKLLPPLPQTDDHAVQEFMRELSFLHTLRHPYLVKCLGGGVEELQPFIARELLRGEGLDCRLKRLGPVPWPVAVAVTRQVCSALAFAADNRNLFHLRLSPSKILFTETGDAKVADFRNPTGTIGVSYTAAGRTIESLMYQAPEQICGKPEPSQKTDLYTLGCILFEMLTGRPPFTADSPQELAQQHLTADPPRIAMLLLDCPIWLDDIVAQLLEKNPDRRPHFASSLGVALQETMEKVSTGASAAAHALGGGATAIRAPKPDAEVRELVAPKRKKRPQGPIYERLWFLLTCLALLIGIVTWVVWPAGEEKLFARAQAIMESGDRDQWETARREYLEPLLRRFPAGTHAAEAQKYLDQIDMTEAEDRLQSTSLLRAPPSRGQRLYVEAREFEEFGDLATAAATYQKIIDGVGSADERDRGFAKLAQRQLDRIRGQAATPPAPAEFLQAKLQEADELASKGQVAAARRLWLRIVSLYARDEQFRAQVQQSQEKLYGKEPPEPGNDQPKPGKTDGSVDPN
jgi:hypothetical protein